MSKREKVTVEERIEAARVCVEGRMSQAEAARRLGVGVSSIKSWVARYRAGGSLAFRALEHNQVYSSELKKQAVEDYLSGKASQTKIFAKYGLRSSCQLRNWIKCYNSGKDFGHKMSGGSRMKEGRETTFEERITIAKDCIENGQNYGETAIKYNVSYQQVYTWVKKYKELGEKGLEDRRGKRTVSQEPRTELEEAKIRIAQLEHELYLTQVERDLLKKLDELEGGGCLSQVKHRHLYDAIQFCVNEKHYPLDLCCSILHVSRSAYYKWRSGRKSHRQLENERISALAEKIHMESPDKGYRRIHDDLLHDHAIRISDKRMLRICRSRDIKSTIKYRNYGCTRNAVDPQYLAENILDRDFHAEKPNEKWLTDVTEFKWYEKVGNEWAKHKVYLSAILDLYDRRIVSYVIRNSNDNPLVYDTFDNAVEANPDAHPIFHSDRGFQYTNRAFHQKLETAGMTQSMSRVAHCIDNGPMEGFWGILKRERYYGRRFTNREELVKMIDDYIGYYNNRRLQRNLGVLTPMEKNAQYYLAA